MNPALRYATTHWFSLFLLAVTLGSGGWLAFTRRRRGTWSLGGTLAASACALAALGGLLLPEDWAFWVGAAAVTALFFMLLAVIITGSWSARLGYGVGAVLLICAGGAFANTIGAGLAEVGRVVVSLEPTQPWWLLLLVLLPLIVYLSYRSLAGLGPIRRWVAIGLRCLLVLLLILALAEVRLRHQDEKTTVLFVVDRSLSIPEEFDPGANPDSVRVDRRWERVEKFVNESVRLRGGEHVNDAAGLILFGRRPRLEFPPSTAPSFNFKLKDVGATIDGNYTDIAAALKLALASFPEGTGKRIVLISDGNENLGNAEEQARIARTNGVQIDVVPLAAGYKNENEVLVQSVEAPPRTEQGSRIPIRVLVRSYNPRPVYGTLILKQVTDTSSKLVEPSPLKVRLHPGLNSIAFRQQPLTDQSYTYQAIFQPEGVQTATGQVIQGLPGDRVQNNSASTHVVALGQRRILLVEPNAGDHRLLIDRLQTVGSTKYKIHTITVDQLPQNKEELAVFLSSYDCLILANVAASDVEAGEVGARQFGVITDEQQEVIRSNTHDQGCGLIMIGGHNGYGAGGWQGTPVEKALPVDCEIKSFKVQGKSGLAMIMHASEMADGNRWQKEIAKLAIKKLQSTDEVGVIQWEWGGHQWHIPLQVIGMKKTALLAQVDRMTPGDMMDFDGAMMLAGNALVEPRRELATRHIIIISDGDPALNNRGILRKLKDNKVTVTTVGVATHGAPQDAALKSISDATGGRFYKVTNARALPAIYIKEMRRISQSMLYERRFQPQLKFRDGPADKLPDPLPPLLGYVRTTAKPSPLVTTPIVAPAAGDQEFPILSYWHYGLGKSVAFTSDARSRSGKAGWDQEWANSDMYGKFWEQVVDWSLRPTETGRLVMTTEYRDGEVRVTVDARDTNNKPLTDLNLQGAVTPPNPKADDAKKLDLKFEQKNSGLYEARFKADEAGSYFINAQSRRRATVVENGKHAVKEESDSVRSGVTIPYSPEFSDLESNTALLERLREMTGGKTFSEDLLARAAATEDAAAAATAQTLAAEVFRRGLPQSKSLQPVWYWLVFTTGVLLFFDVAVRRIAIQPAEAVTAAERVWSRLRGRAAVALETPQFIERLKSRKAQVDDTLEQLRAARRFDGATAGAAAAPPPGADAVGVPSSPRPAPRPAAQAIAPDKEKEAADFASRLLKAKKRVWEERDKEQEG